MIHSTNTLRVRYADTDPMKYVYYGNYAEYLEVARVELFRGIGMSYDEIEKRGIWLPVSEFKIKYLQPARYDQILTIHTYVKKIPGVRIEFEYEIFGEEGERISEASTTLFFLDSARNKIVKCPDFLMKLILNHWKDEQNTD
ncbi:thioesterase family protein [Kaistella sp. PBT33-4]|uniref:acyl-CoA thioesterase n=1 Tax=Kaistella sp. PBT33-4 TaxID=3032000 RepID=UPI0023D8566A|nr:thioesterase family protein [Kaistella sp. PBT33-4]MDF0719579.1 thioesterase family protein [Kaistella sp. PBT33-4]